MEYIALLLSVLAGALIVITLKPNGKTVSVLLTFSGAYLLGITLLNFLPEVYNSDVKDFGFFIIMGFDAKVDDFAGVDRHFGFLSMAHMHRGCK